MDDIGNKIFEMAENLWGIPRSLTGEGTRMTLYEIKKLLPNLAIHSVPTGYKAFDWTVPKEWNVNSAFIITPDGDRICDFQRNNLHLVGYSTPFVGVIDLNELQSHLHSIPDKPNAIPYVTSYYKEYWGFCISHSDREKLSEGKYQIVIDATLEDGELNYGELVIDGATSQEVLFSTYICHPSMANNELSGPCLSSFLAKYLVDFDGPLKYTYRFLFIPETIGSITYLSKNIVHLKNNVVAGFNVTCVGDERCYSYLPSRNGKTLSDEISLHLLNHIGESFKHYTWLDRGSDERQFCAPGVDLPIATLMRSKYGTYPEYHSSLDTLGTVVTRKGLQESYNLYCDAIHILEKNCNPIALTIGEPQMSKRDLYKQNVNGQRELNTKVMMDFLSYSDGNHSLLDIANITGIPFNDAFKIFSRLKGAGLICN